MVVPKKYNSVLTTLTREHEKEVFNCKIIDSSLLLSLVLWTTLNIYAHVIHGALACLIIAIYLVLFTMLLKSKI